MDMDKELKVKVNVIGIEEATEKAEKYIELLKEAKTLAEELASIDFEINSEFQS